MLLFLRQNSTLYVVEDTEGNGPQLVRPGCGSSLGDNLASQQQRRCNASCRLHTLGDAACRRNLCFVIFSVLMQTERNFHHRASTVGGGEER